MSGGFSSRPSSGRAAARSAVTAAMAARSMPLYLHRAGTRSGQRPAMPAISSPSFAAMHIGFAGIGALPFDRPSPDLGPGVRGCPCQVMDASRGDSDRAGGCATPRSLAGQRVASGPTQLRHHTFRSVWCDRLATMQTLACEAIHDCISIQDLGQHQPQDHVSDMSPQDALPFLIKQLFAR